MIADIIVIVLILLCTLIGYKRGLINVAVGIIGFVIALVFALILYTPISNYIIENTEVVSNLKNTIITKFYSEEESNDGENSSTLSEIMANYIDEYTEEMKEDSSDFVAEQIAIAAVRVVTWIALFIGAKLLTLILKLFAEAIGQIPIIKQFNKAGGIIYGILQGLVITYIALGAISLINPMLGENEMNKQIDQSHICKFMYDNNIILNIIL